MEKPPNDIKQRNHSEEADNPDKAMICINTIPFTSNTIKNLVVNKSLHYYYIQKESNDKNKMMINIFSSYVEPLLKDINYTTFIQECKLNPDAAEYERNIDANMSKPSDKK